MENRVYVSVCGNIGAGKTSLVERLCREFGWQPYYEGVVDHPYLEDYYQDMKRWGFQTQIYFLTARLRQQQEIAQIPASVCQDRSIYEDHEIFARSLTNLGIMSERDYRTYRLLFESITPYISRPDLLIYLARLSFDPGKPYHHASAYLGNHYHQRLPGTPQSALRGLDVAFQRLPSPDSEWR